MEVEIWFFQEVILECQDFVAATGFYIRDHGYNGFPEKLEHLGEDIIYWQEKWCLVQNTKSLKLGGAPLEAKPQTH